MREQLLRLIELQALEEEIQRIRERLSRIPGELQRILEEIQVLAERRDGLERELQEKRLHARKLEHELEDLEQKILGERHRTREVKTQEEYDALLKEIAFLEERKQEVEEAAILALEEAEQFARALPEVRARLETRIQELEAQREDLEREKNALEEEYHEKEEDRERRRYYVEDRFLRMYDRLFSHLGLPVLVPLSEEGSCSGCGAALSADLMAEIHERLYVRCEVCSRWVVLPAVWEEPA